MTEKLSARSLAALELLKNGAKIWYGLERQYNGGEKFTYRLKKNGHIIKGFGFAALYPLTDGWYVRPVHWTSVSTTYAIEDKENTK